MKILYFILLPLSFCLLLGCSPLAQLGKAELTGLTTEQIEALDKAGQSVMVCAQAAGPPGAGALVVVAVPKAAQGKVAFSVDCHPTVAVELGK